VQPRETAAEVAVAGAAETAAEGAAAGAAEAAAERAAVRVAEPEAIERTLVGLLDSYAHKAAGTRAEERALLEHAAYKARAALAFRALRCLRLSDRSACARTANLHVACCTLHVASCRCAAGDGGAAGAGGRRR
jgi:hypothetical protein